MKIRINTEGPCANSFYCLSILATKQTQKEWEKDKILYESNNRLFCLVTIDKPDSEASLKQLKRHIDVDKKYIMDAITGTLYYEDGKCLSSGMIPIRRFKRVKK
jgi:hypothetical protein